MTPLQPAHAYHPSWRGQMEMFNWTLVNRQAQRSVLHNPFVSTLRAIEEDRGSFICRP